MEEENALHEEEKNVLQEEAKKTYVVHEDEALLLDKNVVGIVAMAADDVDGKMDNANLIASEVPFESSPTKNNS